jgi:hypothetical protein
MKYENMLAFRIANRRIIPDYRYKCWPSQEMATGSRSDHDIHLMNDVFAQVCVAGEGNFAGRQRF